MGTDLTPLFIRLPRQQAAALDRLAGQSGRSKQHVVSELVGHALAPPKPGAPALGRVEVATAVDNRIDEVLTLDEVASVLKLPAAAVRQRVEEGDLPARRFGDEWRFSKFAVLAWLAGGDKPRGRRRS
jgi:excisionase family DNA binding protein